MPSICLSPQRVFVFHNHSSWRSAWESLAAIAATLRPAPGGGVRPVYFMRGPETHHQPSVRGFWYSVLLHVCVMALLTQLSLASPALSARPQPVSREYDLTTLNLSAYLPALRAPGPGGAPGRGSKPDREPARGATIQHPRTFVISAPVRPDNTRQTIIQPDSPPDLRIPFELNVPNLIISGQMTQPKRPMPQTIRTPTQSRGVTAEAAAVPEIRSEITAALELSMDRAPQLPVPPPPAAASAESSGASTAGAGPLVLLTVGGRPAGLEQSLALPPGNRYGEFSISPDGGRPGSPGGVPGGDPEGGRGGKGTGGDWASTGVGSGSTGGGGGENGNAVPGVAVSIAGGNSRGGSEATSAEGESLEGNISALGIYAVPRSTGISPNLLQVTSGPAGGGGLRIYGVLRGGKVHTTYLPMPGKSWTLQYCQVKAASSTAEHGRAAKAIQFGPGLVPPMPEARFDFRREGVPPDKSHEMIVLHGVITETGAVRDLRILQGVTAKLDEAAVNAFRRWKFRPATVGEQRVAVEILVGIPVISGTD